MWSRIGAVCGALLVVAAAGCASGASVPEPPGAWTYGAGTATVTGPDGRLVFATAADGSATATLEVSTPQITCPSTGCMLQVEVDGAESQPWPVTTPADPSGAGTTTATFARADELVALVGEARTMVVGFPRGESGVGTATFDVVGADRDALPGT